MKILVAFSGSVATVKCFEILTKLARDHQICAVFTEAAWSMMEAAIHYDPEGHEQIKQRLVLTWEAYSDCIPPTPEGHQGAHQHRGDSCTMPSEQQADILVYRSASEWAHYRHVGKDPVLHIELRKWADCVLIAPLSANTLAKLANGLADNLLTCILRAWPVGRKPWYVAPAMNTAMWEHPLTAKQLHILEHELHANVIPPKGASKLACGDVGGGAMHSVDGIVQALEGAAAQLSLPAAAGATVTAEADT